MILMTRREIFMSAQPHTNAENVWHDSVSTPALSPHRRHAMLSSIGSASAVSARGSFWPTGIPNSRPTYSDQHASYLKWESE